MQLHKFFFVQKQFDLSKELTLGLYFQTHTLFFLTPPNLWSENGYELHRSFFLIGILF